MKKRLLIIAVTALAFAGAFAIGYNVSVRAGAYSGTVFGRPTWTGYFTGELDTNGTNVLPSVYQNNTEAFPDYLNASNPNAAEDFIDFIVNREWSGFYGGTTPQRQRGAAFIINTMLGHNAPGVYWLEPHHLTNWANMIRTMANAGNITWRANYTFNINSYWQGSGCCDGTLDDAFYSVNNDPGPQDDTMTAPSMLFYNQAGQLTYALKWECANPVSFNTLPLSWQPWQAFGTTAVSDANPNPGDTATQISTRPGDRLTFRHSLYNEGPNWSGQWSRLYGSTHSSPWTAQYWNNTALSGAPVVTRTENNIFYDGYNPPAPGVAADGFSVRWTKTENLPAGTYQFSTFNDDGARVFVDGALVVNGWSNGGGRPYKAERNLTAGNHTIVVEFYEAGGPGTMQFNYKYITKPWEYFEPIQPGQTRLMHTETVDVPANAVPGSKICRSIVWWYKNSWQAGDPWAPPSHTAAGVGSESCATVVANFNLTPVVNATVNGVPSPGSLAEVGDQITFLYSVNNSGSASSSVGCTIYGITKNGYASAPNPADSTSDPGYVQPAHGCPRIFAPGSTPLVNETITVQPGHFNRTICRALWVNPATFGGQPLGREVCVRIVAKPYVRVHGGDVSAGNGFGDSCTPNSGAAIVTWNRGAGAGYAGGGTQYAAMALSIIRDFSSALGNVGGAQKPHGLSFANTTAVVGTGDFGGDYVGLPCIPDHYGTRPGTVTPIPANVGLMTNGDYGNTSGNISLGGGTINSPNRISVFVKGNVYISSNIVYGGAWTVENMPSFRLIVSGNILIDNDVSRLDGLYVAQEDGPGTGIIYTCTNSLGLIAPTHPSFANECDNQKLTVNGALVATQVQLGRTFGTTSRALASETAASGFAGEAINYGPIMWIPQFGGGDTRTTYDAITSLPPIL